MKHPGVLAACLLAWSGEESDDPAVDVHAGAYALACAIVKFLAPEDGKKK